MLFMKKHKVIPIAYVKSLSKKKTTLNNNDHF
jgi:hypothetical protein